MTDVACDSRALSGTPDTARACTVVLTDHAWPDLDLERSIIEGAGLKLVTGPQAAGSATDVERLVAGANPQAILTCWAPVSAEAIALPDDLRIVARLGVGLDNIAVPAATARGAWVTNVPDYCVSEVSDHAIALMLAHCRGIVRLDAATKASGWHPAGEGLERISDLTVGIIGYGRIGRETARKLRAFGCRILAHSLHFHEGDAHAEVATLERVQVEADVIILHVPLMPATAGMIDRRFLEGCRRRPLLINVSRGGLVDNQALLEALKNGKLRGAALDVIDGEPFPPTFIIERADVLATPHIAFASTTSMHELRRRACEEVVRVLAGAPPHYPCNEPTRGTPLRGGVASDIRIVDGPTGPEVVKKALAKLKVAADWFSDPKRSGTEVAAIDAFAELIGPDVVPKILWRRPEQHMFAMRRVDPRLRNWKHDLLAGHVDDRTAARAGALLGQLHNRSAERADLRERFGDITYFHQLRIEPFFLRVADRLPALADGIRDVVTGMNERRSALVHGDYSPKNILADGSDVVILDFEVAHWGDPRFDVGFCLSHLLLKAHRASADHQAFASTIRAFLSSYVANGPSIVDTELTRLTACLMLARFEGSSPVDYAAEVNQPVIRALAAAMLHNRVPSVLACLDPSPELI